MIPPWYSVTFQKDLLFYLPIEKPLELHLDFYFHLSRREQNTILGWVGSLFLQIRINFAHYFNITYWEPINLFGVRLGDFIFQQTRNVNKQATFKCLSVMLCRHNSIQAGNSRGLSLDLPHFLDTPV